MKAARNPVMILAGAQGVAGRMHGQIYASLDVTVVEFDAHGLPPSSAAVRRIAWDEAIMDICTPTAAHTASLAWGYARGVRRFIVEKPAAASLAAWRAQVSVMPNAQIAVLNPYLFSRSFRIALDAAPDITEIVTVFNKDRQADDLRGRGADAKGQLPHLFGVEVPHQLAMALAVAPGLRVSHARYDTQARRGAQPQAPVAGTVVLEDTAVTRVVVATNLRSARRRLLRLRNSDGHLITVHFPTTPDLMAHVHVQSPSGQTRMIFEGRDDLLRNTLTRVMDCFESGSLPGAASARLAATVLARIDDARRMAESRHAPQAAKKGNVEVAVPA